MCKLFSWISVFDTGPPDAPSNFRVQRMVGDHSILLSWTTPDMDELARSNSNIVKGYKVHQRKFRNYHFRTPTFSRRFGQQLKLLVEHLA